MMKYFVTFGFVSRIPPAKCQCIWRLNIFINIISRKQGPKKWVYAHLRIYRVGGFKRQMTYFAQGVNPEGTGHRHGMHKRFNGAILVSDSETMTLRCLPSRLLGHPRSVHPVFYVCQSQRLVSRQKSRTGWLRAKTCIRKPNTHMSSQTTSVTAAHWFGAVGLFVSLPAS